MAEQTGAQEPSWDELRPQLIKMALELGPLVVFFAFQRYFVQGVLAGSVK